VLGKRKREGVSRGERVALCSDRGDSYGKIQCVSFMYRQRVNGVAQETNRKSLIAHNHNHNHINIEHNGGKN
jgi:hypothetical protein